MELTADQQEALDAFLEARKSGHRDARDLAEMGLNMVGMQAEYVTASGSYEPPEEEEQPKKKRGRPRKQKEVAEDEMQVAYLFFPEGNTFKAEKVLVTVHDIITEYGPDMLWVTSEWIANSVQEDAIAESDRRGRERIAAEEAARKAAEEASA